jgi:hypothetical protein
VNVILLQVFVSLMLVAGSVLLFAVSIRYRDHEHADRLSLIPLEDDGTPAPPSSASSQSDSTR